MQNDLVRFASRPQPAEDSRYLTIIKVRASVQMQQSRNLTSGDVKLVALNSS